MTRALLTLSCLLVACRPDPGLPDYSGMAALFDAGSGPQGSLPGPSPYVPGTRRLAFGIFYESGASETLLVDDATRHYYIFGLPSGMSTYTQQSSSDRVEGLHSDEFTFGPTGFWGGGLIWDRPTDLSAYTTMHVSLVSSDSSLAAIDVRMLSGDGPSPKNIPLKAGDYGWKNDGLWHHLAVPLADFVAQGIDLKKVRGPFVLGGVNPGNGETLLVDNVYFE
jgi:hypothetical protein